MLADSKCNNDESPEPLTNLLVDTLASEELKITFGSESGKKQNYVPQSAIAKLCSIDAKSTIDMDIFGDRRSKVIGNFDYSLLIFF